VKYLYKGGAVNLFLAGEGVMEETKKQQNREGEEACVLRPYGDPAAPGGWQFEGREGSERGGMGAIHQSSKQRRAPCGYPFLSLSSPALSFGLVLFFLLRFRSIFQSSNDAL